MYINTLSMYGYAKHNLALNHHLPDLATLQTTVNKENGKYDIKFIH